LKQRTFLRRFKTGTGMTPIEYTQHLRIGKARELLEFTKRPIDQVAYAVGYEDASVSKAVSPHHRIVTQ
jgi:transcriptional regulator GlxA family with amidase domain